MSGSPGNDILNRAAVMDDLDDACRLIQDHLGQTDGGLAGVTFSDLEPGDWSALDFRDRHSRLAAYWDLEIAAHSEGQALE